LKLTDPDESISYVIDQILGRGVTVIGSIDKRHRMIFQDQMALAIQSGESFLGHYRTEQKKVKVMHKGEADYQISCNRLKDSDVECILHKNYNRIKSINDDNFGLIGSL